MARDAPAVVLKVRRVRASLEIWVIVIALTSVHVVNGKWLRSAARR
jgi:hypothetical protein